MSLPSFRAALAVVAAVLVASAGVALAAKPKQGSYHHERCIPGGGCIEQIDFSVKKGPPAKIKNFVYFNGFTCGEVEVKRSIKIKRSGKFSFSGTGENPVEEFPVTIKGKFVSKKKAKGTLEIDDDCLDSEVEFTAKYEK